MPDLSPEFTRHFAAVSMPPVNAQNGVADMTDAEVNQDYGDRGGAADVRRRQQLDDCDKVNLELQNEISSIPNATKEAVGNTVSRHVR